jgi:hypothetical protein
LRKRLAEVLLNALLNANAVTRFGLWFGRWHFSTGASPHNTLALIRRFMRGHASRISVVAQLGDRWSRTHAARYRT